MMEIRNDARLIWSLMLEIEAEATGGATAYFAEALYRNAMTIDFPPWDNDELISILLFLLSITIKSFPAP